MRKNRRCYPTPEAVLADILREIRKLHRRRAPLNLTALKRRRPDLLAKVYALKPFVGWKNALAAAGISYEGFVFPTSPHTRSLAVISG